MIAVSTFSALLYVAFNSMSVWLTATLLNNILSDFDKLIQQNEILKSSTSMSANDHLKLLTNSLILKSSPLETLRSLSLSILIIFTLKNIFLYLKNITLSFVQLKLIQIIRERVYAHLHSLSLTFFKKKKSGEITSIIINDVANMRLAFSTGFQKLLVEPVNVLVMVVLLFIINWQLALITLITIPVSAMIIVGIGKSIRRKSHRTAVSIAGITSIISETISAMRIVKAFVMERYEIAKFNRETKNHFVLLFRRSRLRHISSPVTELIGVLIGVVLLWTGGKAVLIDQSITSEDFIRFILILFSTFTPIRNLSNVNTQLQIGIASAERVFTILDTKPSIVNRPDAITKKGFESSITFDNVYFSYVETDEAPILSDISFTIKRGQIVALVGQSGSGKSTIADLIPRFYDVDKGRICIDGIDIRDISVPSLRNLMGIVNQDTILFNDSIRNNIAYGNESVSLDEIKAAAQASYALSFIEEMPDGFDTMVGEKGVKLSGGQRQRIAIARALLKDPPILILDEATSSLDTESEREVQRAMESLMVDRTALVIAHRLSTIVKADEILVLKDGKIIEQGTHVALLAAGGYYRHLFEMQFQ
ncbi:MAG: ABC transporter ATP-binding protein [Fidelibacterota bacterium]